MFLNVMRAIGNSRTPWAVSLPLGAFGKASANHRSFNHPKGNLEKRGKQMIRTTRTLKPTTILWVLISLLLIPAFSQARVISVQMSTPTIAFGGYSWPGVGPYEKITGVAYAEVDPVDHRNAIIVDIGLAEPQAAPGEPGKTPSGKVAYLLNFYILKPVNLNQVDRKLNGYGKMMYEPPNRGGKTWTALGRVTGGGNDPATITDTTILANSFLMPRGYTLVWSGWEPLVPFANLGTSLTASVALPIAKNLDGSTITGPAYEYIVSSGACPRWSIRRPHGDKTQRR